MKELKNSLKKESCYTTILSTARIRGVEKIRLITHDDQEQEQEVMSKTMFEFHYQLVHYYPTMVTLG